MLICNHSTFFSSKCLASSEQLQNNIEKFFLLLRPSKCVIHVPPILEASCGVTDADSGTFSSEEDDMMNTNGTKEAEKATRHFWTQLIQMF